MPDISNCIVLIDKPAGITSFDAVAQIRKITGIRKVGHSGTLDRAASGLIVAALGRATRLTRFFLESDKSYTVEIQLGIVTDTYDSEGEVIGRTDPSFLSEEQIADAVSRLTGEQMQLPPLYSALKVNGKRASDRVRRGEDVDLAPRKITIYRAEISAFSRETMRLTLEIDCSKGTYIRSFARDLGEMLGCGASLSALRRTKSGIFSIEKAVLPADLKEKLENGGECFVSPESAVTGMSKRFFSHEDSVKILNGLKIDASRALASEDCGTKEYALFSEEKKLIAIANISQENGIMRYLCVFN